jgi:uncharacterized protein involved in response to NO
VLPLFSIGFRPFFLLAGMQAVVSVILWVLIYSGIITLNTVWQSPVFWHGHEMIFGFTVAVIAGFLLTAIPNWTGTRPIEGVKLILLVCLWLAGRTAMNTSLFSPMATAVIDSAFLPVLICMLAPVLIRAKMIANMAFLIILGLLATFNILIHLSVLNMVEIDVTNLLFCVIHLVIFIIAVISGRVIPFFTQNGLALNGIRVEVVSQPIIDKIALGLTLLLPVVGFFQNFEGTIFAVLAFSAAIIHAVRLSRWHGLKTTGIPILWILHLGYSWLIIGLFLEGLHAFSYLLSIHIAMHAFTIGAIGTMILGMITRVGLGHTGREIKAPKSIVMAYFILQSAVVLRMLGGTFFENLYVEFIVISGVLWAVAFTMFTVIYLSILISKRYDAID